MVETKHAFIAVCILTLAWIGFIVASSWTQAATANSAYGGNAAQGRLAGGGTQCGPQGCANMPLGDTSLKEFVVKATRFAFSPSTLTVNKGDRVRLTLQNADGMHGLSISEYGVNLQPAAGQIQTTEFVADKAGTFNFACTVYCGSGHMEMSGKLVVNDATGAQVQAAAPAQSVQEVVLRASSYGYNPPNLNVKAGQPVRFVFSADPNAGCGRQVIIDGVGVNLVSRNGETVSATFTPPTPGQYSFHCSMNMFRGVLTAS